MYSLFISQSIQDIRAWKHSVLDGLDGPVHPPVVMDNPTNCSRMESLSFKLGCRGNKGGREMISILFIGMIVSLFIPLSYALCRASDEGERSFGYKEGQNGKEEEMTDEDAGQAIQ